MTGWGARIRSGCRRLFRPKQGELTQPRMWESRGWGRVHGQLLCWPPSSFTVRDIIVYSASLFQQPAGETSCK